MDFTVTEHEKLTHVTSDFMLWPTFKETTTDLGIWLKKNIHSSL